MGIWCSAKGKIKIRARRTGSSQLSFDTTNIKEVPEFKSKLIDRSARANRVRCFFHTKDTLNAETETVRDDDGDQRDREPRIGNRGVVEDTLRFAAVDNLSQAERLGEQILRENIQAKWLVEFATSIKGLALEPGDIVDVTHPSQPSWAQKLFRIESIVLDEGDNPTLTCSEYCDCAYI
jgi:predicted phage tail protein